MKRFHFKYLLLIFTFVSVILICFVFSSKETDIGQSLVSNTGDETDSISFSESLSTACDPIEVNPDDKLVTSLIKSGDPDVSDVLSFASYANNSSFKCTLRNGGTLQSALFPVLMMQFI